MSGGAAAVSVKRPPIAQGWTIRPAFTLPRALQAVNHRVGAPPAGSEGGDENAPLPTIHSRMTARVARCCTVVLYSDPCRAHKIRYFPTLTDFFIQTDPLVTETKRYRLLFIKNSDESRNGVRGVRTHFSKTKIPPFLEPEHPRKS